MRSLRYLSLILLPLSLACNKQSAYVELNISTCAFQDNSNPTAKFSYKDVKGALLGTRFKSLEELKSVIQIEYFNYNSDGDSASQDNYMVRISHCSNGIEVISVLESGVSQGDIWNARYGKKNSDRISLLFNSPYAIANRKDLEKVYTLSRWRPEWFGEGDLAFFDIAKKSAANINTEDLAFRHAKDSTEKGYLNSFNHITAQAFITSCFSEELADFIADAHERYAHPELLTGKFTDEQLKDLEEGPVDNYVDIINNEWGQELGIQLREKYNISRETNWTPELLANYLNDLQSYYSWAFQIGFKPFRQEDEEVLRFSNKINAVMKGRVRSNS